MITIIDYGLGNIKAISNVYENFNIKTKIAKSKDDLEDAQRIILPGVGHFDHAMDLLNKSGMRTKLDELILIQKKPILGICVGMQIMANSSEEGIQPGLKYMDAEVKKFDVSKIKHQTKIPHMGWNNVKNSNGDALFNEIEIDASFYFLHSYHVVCKNENEAISVTDYEGKFISVFRKNHIFGVQFHPEKSHRAGELLLRNFAKI
ncbi:imidazole glycerol phosphate synthase subunit HisH [Halpernia frigidisoli]|uniref:Imidazole glycerol phosphate synthase subunit HisH n=1 Tax=Halpernia frigidisoli TaxID=1125876 RepID=A0A1I3FCV7_9FLAO|nr:imidazole glycerol phosphate synthase subunit HisH [Halpernia frigidisoli]SFI09029.1 glutamine amidotransferase [Halpernia frigidisoli]